MIGTARPLILGSSSPRRAEILTTLGLPFEVRVASVDEQVRPAEAPHEYIERIVDEKANAIAALGSIAESGAPASAQVLEPVSSRVRLVADTLVTRAGRIYGKPVDKADALVMLEGLVGTSHEVMTRYRLDLPGGTSWARTVTSQVHFRSASRAELERYVDSGEGLDKAGAYAIQGLGSFLVERLDGSYGAVVGLPACELVADLLALGALTAFPLAQGGTSGSAQ
ncbi:MAG TPA: nucleoside triphosphate pyrophosphatase [Polyangiaceae bacterium]|nr:nucleoside triphosphate pyrophosphatase [Polyangiaceae bacterium]